ncbi:Protein of unknown function (DUF630 and DUF632) [Quillaja saponaria]|uniref:Nitrate regulatory gene2 protein-like n=1 Tax=Quillaja saponaria TaxID=32244 RepID=A0AAD7PEZ8_QUISA|nr:Protein of unknown function (DUF630 and DUF632) [Quillaja saponaria]
MGCATSKKKHDEDDVVSLCKERKRLMKLVVERRYAFAEAHRKYNQSLHDVAMAIRLFVARHSSPSSPFLITFPNSNTYDTTQSLIANPMFSQNEPYEPAHNTSVCLSSDSEVSLDSSEVNRKKQEQEHPNEKAESKDDINAEEDEDTDEEEELVCEYFYGDIGVPLLSREKNFGWDFFNFNPFDAVTAKVVSGLSHNTEEDLRFVREQEGIPELEENGEGEVVDVKNGDVGHVESEIEAMRTGDEAKLNQWRQMDASVIDTPAEGRELLEAMKDVEDHFLRAYNSGLEVSRMLEANKTQLQSGLDNIKESSARLIRSITWNRSTSLQSSSCKSLLTSSSKSSSTWTEFSNDLFDDCGGMVSGSHSLTLERIYAWEKKLYEEVKAGEKTRKIYERKCSQLRKQEGRGSSPLCKNESMAEVVDLYARILVTIRSAESMSNRIQRLKDEELLPQLVELLNGLARNWKIMFKSHETQYKIMYEVRFFNSPALGNFCNDSHRLATLQLEAELQNWHACFATYVTSQKVYIEALDGWLSKFMSPEVELQSQGRSSVLPCTINDPPLLVISHDWLASLEKLPDKVVTYAIKSFGKDIQALWAQQGEEQQHKRKVDGLAKELDHKVMAFQMAESRILGIKLCELEPEANIESQIEYLSKRKYLLDEFAKSLDAEKAKLQDRMKETQDITVNAFQTGFCSVFESISEFSKASVKMYEALKTFK